MLCQHCKQREAKVQLSKIENGLPHDVYLCEVCAQQTHEVSFIFNPAIVPEFLQALFGFNLTSVEQPNEMACPKSCPKCGMTFAQITQAGKLGCSTCYETFEAYLEPLLRRVHGGGQNVGKVPARRGVVIKRRMEHRKLKEKLQVLIQQEAFEEAAVVRDQIRQIEQAQEGGSQDA
ncbi:UvrB/UvrC motif-containing protein [Desulfosporosinus sp. Sb-LF]|uniref:UvrB/UvrC motif-containing protein n=1 Tax=Desulfosporosinus sp. Sb-LF TaxID=2560027 RepID=UPI00107F75C0|nr:UvrB/UvrC motif-containing protein [Desulfosporosinus sp. Sb-LF]TGE31536.1 DNA helicase UvrBC [Desulfosporosinus sp. Sb-LF]